MYWSVHRSTQNYIHDLERESRATARSLSPRSHDDIRANEWDQVDDVLERVRTGWHRGRGLHTNGSSGMRCRVFPERLALSPEKLRLGKAG